MELHKSQGTGLLRLVINVNYFLFSFNTNNNYILFGSIYLLLKRNNFSSDHEPLMFKLTEAMKTRDPVYKLSTNTNQDNETASISGKDSALARPAPVKSGKH